MFDTIVPIKIKRLEGCFDIPKYQTNGAAAMDLYASEQCVVHRGLVTMVPTGIAIALPEGFEAQIRARSGMGAKGIIVTNAPGTIDSDYRGEIKVLLSSLVEHYYDPYEDKPVTTGRLEEGFLIKRGDRIAQMLIAPVYRGVFTEVDALDTTQRGEGGFGSTGTK